MMKFVVILLILLVLLGMVAIRFRKQIVMGIQMWKMLRGMRNAGAPKEKQIRKAEEDLTNVPLVKCLKCGTWVAQTKAMKLGGNTYCSSTCVERSEVRV